MRAPAKFRRCGFPRERLARLSQLERWHFWFAGRRALIDRLLKQCVDGTARRILDLGCGSGLGVETLTLRGYRVVGLDRRPEGLHATRRSLSGLWLLQADATSLPFVQGAFDVVLLLDLLEHLDDRMLLAEVGRVLRPGGWVLVTVPAMPWLWSYRDEAAEHLRRYTRRQLTRLLADMGLPVQGVYYYQCVLFPLVVITRLWGRSGPGLRDLEERPISLLNTVLTWVNRAEVRLGGVVRWPWGSSLVALCRKA